MTADNMTTADAAAEYLLGDQPRPRRPRKIERATRRAEAMSLRLAGVRVDQIAKQFGVKPRTIYTWLSEAAKDIPREQADEMRMLELDRLDALQRAVWQDAMRGDPRAVDRVLQIMGQRARYVGLYDSRADGLEQVGNLLDRLINGEG